VKYSALLLIFLSLHTHAFDITPVNITKDKAKAQDKEQERAKPFYYTANGMKVFNSLPNQVLQPLTGQVVSSNAVILEPIGKKKKPNTSTAKIKKKDKPKTDFIAKKRASGKNMDSVFSDINAAKKKQTSPTISAPTEKITLSNDTDSYPLNLEPSSQP
jgi:hypothetical protein